MIFIIGGSYQGKQKYASDEFGIAKEDFFVCTENSCEIDLSKRAISHIERFALDCVRRGEEPKEFWQKHRVELAEKVLISDDISCGVVPIESDIRAWREASGRANNYLAQEADQVWRVFCGFGMRLK